MIDITLVSGIVNIGFLLAALYFRNHFEIAKSFLKEIGDLIVVASDAANDNKIDSEEAVRILKEVKDIKNVYDRIT